ncbi:YecA family protein [Vibrio paucivorans]|uniref:YecA family protein n=1 Tax=Vibrio paucivorans TaxID=2829489 RepID=A0A9X3CGX8_9VIBR|nr:YecA family protein [Vibrio paucivorans]MCW8335658.1 YecA family protein [Vibrio paucivorans]
MTYHFISLENIAVEESATFIEGAILAANFATKPLQPESWLPSVINENSDSAKPLVVEQINKQYSLLKRSEYQLTTLLNQEELKTDLADFAEGFMTVWPTIEEQWQEAQVGDGTLRMLHALLTTFMLAIDEEQTQLQMKQAGIDTPPSLDRLIEQVDLMIAEVALAADEAMVGAKSQSVNPFKNIGRNDPCPCESGKKFKQCCGK